MTSFPQSPEFSYDNGDDSYAGTLSNTSIDRNGDDANGDRSIFATAAIENTQFRSSVNLSGFNKQNGRKIQSTLRSYELKKPHFNQKSNN